MSFLKAKLLLYIVEEQRVKYYQAIVVLFVALAVLSGIQALIATVDPATIDPELQPLWTGIAYVFTTSGATVLFTILRNVLGYGYTWFEADPNRRSQITYEVGQLAATWLRFELYLKGFTAAVMAFSAGTPYEQYAVYIAGAIGLLIDIVRSTFAKLAPQPS